MAHLASDIFLTGGCYRTQAAAVRAYDRRVTALSGGPGLDQDMGGLAGLAGLEVVREQLAGWVAVVRAERSRRAGTAVARPAWKNLVFTGGPGAGRSRTARAVGRIYHQLGVLSLDQVLEVTAADLAAATSRETGLLLDEAVRRADGGILMITDAHAWSRLPDRGQQLLRLLYRELTQSRTRTRDDLAVILAGRPGPVHGLLAASPALAARFPAVINFPGYTAAQLAAIFATLAGEAGFALTVDAASKAATVLAGAEARHSTGSARLAVRLLDQATASQARRVTDAAASQDPAALGTICAADIPGYLDPHDRSADDQRPGQYL
jgi:hypothetical protein